jgi:hypothetical protein
VQIKSSIPPKKEKYFAVVPTNWDIWFGIKSYNNELFFFLSDPFMYGFFPNNGQCIGWRGSWISQLCTLGSLFHSYKQQHVMLD